MSPPPSSEAHTTRWSPTTASNKTISTLVTYPPAPSIPVPESRYLTSQTLSPPRALSFVTNSSSSDFHFTNPIFTTTAEIGGSHYALTASEADSRIQITDITDPASPQATASIAHLTNGFNIRFVSSI